MLAFFRNDMGFGGNNGFTDFKDMLGFNLHNARRCGPRCSWLTRDVHWLLGYLACRYDRARRARAAWCTAIRDAESRTRFIGYRVENYKLWVFVFSAVLAGIAGALYVPQVGIINPSEFQPINSIEVVIWVAVGGRGMLYGAVAGAVLVNYAKTFFTAALPSTGCMRWALLFVAGHAVPAARVSWACSTPCRQEARRRRRSARGRRCPHERSQGGVRTRAGRTALGAFGTGARRSPCPAMPRTARFSTSKTSR